LQILAGFYITKGKPENSYSEIEEDIKEYLQSENLNTIICLGVDGRDGKDQIGLAISNKGIISIARKFHPTDGEINCIQIADNYLSTENNYSRIIEIKGMKLYLAICYDGYGIRKQNLPNPGVHAILNLVHRFNPQGYGNSGEVYFAKYSFAGSSRQWKCPTFGTATFYERVIPEKWPTAVLCSNKSFSIGGISYGFIKSNSNTQGI
jgi:predicted amidohydrolase